VNAIPHGCCRDAPAFLIGEGVGLDLPISLGEGTFGCGLPLRRGPGTPSVNATKFDHLQFLS
jgi:hypothetical protein